MVRQGGRRKGEALRDWPRQELLEALPAQAEQRLNVTDELVHVAFALHLVNDVLVVVVAQTARQLFVVHLRLVLPLTPAPSNLLRIGQFELPLALRPGDAGPRLAVCEQFQKELPELNLSCASCKGNRKGTENRVPENLREL